MAVYEKEVHEVKCDICSLILYTEYDLKMHMKSHTTDMSQQCSLSCWNTDTSTLPSILNKSQQSKLTSTKVLVSQPIKKNQSEELSHLPEEVISPGKSEELSNLREEVTTPRKGDAISSLLDYIW